MPIKIPENLPAAEILAGEGVPLIREQDAVRQDIRPMRIALLNLMPEKIKTETQVARLLGNTPLQVELTLLRTRSYQPRNTSAEHLESFYKTWDEVGNDRFDGLIVTGAPVETMAYEAVDYWRELTDIFDWSLAQVFRSFNICWGAQAALYHRYGINKVALAEKEFGIYMQENRSPTNPLMMGMTDEFPVPVSRHTAVLEADLQACDELEILASNPTSGVCMVQDRATGDVHMFNHIEYDTGTLADEYRRDRKAGKPITLPANYFPGDDPGRAPRNIWRAHAHLLFGNWVNYVYQNTLFELDHMPQRGGVMAKAL